MSSDQTVAIVVIIFLVLGLGVSLYFVMMPSQAAVEKVYSCTGTSQCVSDTGDCAAPKHGKCEEGCDYDSKLEKIEQFKRLQRARMIQDNFKRQQAAVARSRDNFKRQQAAVARSRDNFKRQQAAVARSRDNFKRQQAAVARTSPVVSRKKERFQNRCSV